MGKRPELVEQYIKSRKGHYRTLKRNDDTKAIADEALLFLDAPT